MTDLEILDAYNRHKGNKAELLGSLVMQGEDLERVVRLLQKRGLHPELALKKTWGTTIPEKITLSEIRDWLVRRGVLGANKPKEAQVDAYCENCTYLVRFGFQYCDYIGTTGHRRGCPPGKGCTRRKLIRRRKHEAE